MSSNKGVLPKKNEYGFYEIKMESIGGQGGNLAGKMLAEAIILDQGLNGASFAAYGSEKTGTPVQTYVRVTEEEGLVKINSPIEEPHLLVVFQELMYKTVPITMGFKPTETIIVNTKKSPSEIRDGFKLAGGTVICVDATNIAVEEKVRLNTTILGTICRAAEFISKDSVKKVIKETIGEKYPQLVESNLKGFERGYKEVKIETFKKDGKYPVIPFKLKAPKLGYSNAPIGGNITQPGISALKDLSTSRSGWVPVFHPEKCTHCAQCELTCPDYTFEWVEEEKDGKKLMMNKGIKYQYCKGCLRCVEICPAEALTAEVESKVKLVSA